ncbi:amidase [Diplogelasinospora grovesii]|uniref:Amidase n=1 Tax=Diplogelasinospora grovesii TaxID=303347 RepID=A0AAN6MVL7_9PEZI|nr:amidase [Diplogelasinospora grovesii]
MNNPIVIRLLSQRSSQQCKRGFRCYPIRSFTSTRTHRQIRNWESDEAALQRLKVNQGRLMDELHHTCQWGTGKPWGVAATETGMSRLALSDADKQARDWFVETTQSLGCSVQVDAMGNIFAIRPGREDGPPTCAGSHLDTQPSGGRYDGILGILAGVEMLKVLKDHNVQTAYPVGVVNWTNEEGARFPISMVSSGVWAGEIPLDRAHNLQEVGGGTATMKSELERIGFLGSLPASYKAMPLAAHFELHIEQGPILEAEKQKIGVVKGVQAYRWYTVEVTGREAHTGTTPFSSRGDAMLAAARMIALSHDSARKHSALASTGILTLTPGSVNTIPGAVRFSLDVRAPLDSTVEALEKEFKEQFAKIVSKESTGGLAVEVNWQTDSVSPAIHFHEDCITAVREAAVSVTGKEALVRDMVSGAGHDSVYASRHCPTSMIFVPSRNGISHNPEEYTNPEDCAIGAEVLLQSVLRYDRQRAFKA